MMKFGRRRARPIGLDIGHDAIKMLQLSMPGRPLAVVAASRHILAASQAAGAGLSDVLAQMLAAAPFVGHRVTAALPASIVQSRTLRVAPGSPAEVEATARTEAAALFPFDLRDSTVRVLSAGHVREGTEARQEVIVFAAQNRDVQTFLQQLQAAGLAVESLQLQPLAAYQCVEQLQTGHGAQAVLEIGASRSTLVIGKAGLVAFLRTIEIGGRHLQQAIGQKLGLDAAEVRHLRRRLAREASAGNLRTDPVSGAVFDATRGLAEELARQVVMCFRYHAITFRGQRPDHLALFGGEACDPNLRFALDAALSMPVKAVDPFHGIDTSLMGASDCQLPGGEWAITLGLSMMGGDARGKINSDKTIVQNMAA